MGPASDAGAVVDATLRLHGFSNVYVAASVMPSIPSANTLLPVIALAERSADLLRTRCRSGVGSPDEGAGCFRVRRSPE